MRRRLIVVLSALTLIVGLGTATAASAATTGHPNATTHGKVPAAAAAQVTPQDFCADSSTGLCLNRSGCGTAAGTSLITWTHDLDSCEDFTPDVLGSMCNGGRVTSTCPFIVGSGLNSRYVGAFIIDIVSLTGKCVATDANGLAVLGTCPNASGNGGSTGTVFVWKYAAATNPNYVINRYWSNQNYINGHTDAPAWMCSQGAVGAPVLVANSSGIPGDCQWAEAS